jgi:putative Mg2+ transporter-C (MgtC) family protein
VNTNFLSGWPIELDLTFRLLLAYILGGIIGWDREKEGQPAGLRTHLLVASGAASFTMVFIFGFSGIGTSYDPGRAASQIITGIGFLGAGVIWRNRNRVRGITTAADIWVVAAIGMLAGVGMWFLAALLALLSFLTLRLLKPSGPDHQARQLRRQQTNPVIAPEQEQEK